MFFSRLFYRKPENTYLKNFIFGVEDSLVSTVGLLAGVAAADVTTKAIITTGLVLIVVEGFSMGIGSFLTEETAEEMAGDIINTWKAVKGGLIMLISYILAGLVPLVPYSFYPPEKAMIYSITLSLIGLLLLGFGTSVYYGRPRPWVRATKMFLLGGLAVLSGVAIGKLFHL